MVQVLIFEKFLNNNNVTSDYFIELIKKENNLDLETLVYKDYQDLYRELTSSDYLTETIDWDETNYTYEFWDRLDMKWRELIEDELHIEFGFEKYRINTEVENIFYLVSKTGLKIKI